MSWSSHNTSYPGDTDLRISISGQLCMVWNMDWPYVRHYVKLILGSGQPPSQYVFSLTSGDWMTLSRPQPPVCGRWVEMALMVAGLWVEIVTGLLSHMPRYLCFNQKQWCTIHLSSFPVISGPNGPLGGGEALVTGPATNYRSFTLTTDMMGLLLLTTHHQTWRPGVIGHCQHQTHRRHWHWDTGT